MSNSNSKIESLGVYLPDEVATTEQVLAGCKCRPRWDLERITGIKERRVARGEFASDLAIKAARAALEMSKYAPEQLDMLICTSISKYNRPQEISFEPATSVLVRKAIGAKNALNFDLVNACAGLMNGILVMDGFLKSGAIRSGMVVSGEFNTPLSETAQRQIRHSFDGQLAALTLGDCGAAVILDRSEDCSTGFHQIEMVTGAKHSHFCWSRPSPRGPGGILVTKARSLQRKGNEHFPRYMKGVLARTGWALDEVDTGIPHQVSVRAIQNSTRAVERFMRCEAGADRFVSIAERYGNTTTTSHFLALHEKILAGRISAGHRILFVSGASGIVITHATYTMDDLAERYRASHSKRQAHAAHQD